ncbi:methionyl-tRNA formyltransferase [Roseivirga sp. UBA838]|uniref:methionyl-tRNA formyltransferase n=1 Tax=Roseivirga sp. UBA838 TaxID=1947393 RepID=UPI00257E0741|nr:methionyl-tRNA formyltransferase [Roseivirga sp. UBA838]|tara:strand:- start:47007 stop:47768 length:762 start_codon:yes stop_codon:yes gene_type:complete
MKVVFMSGGARELALKHLLENNVNIVAVVTPKPTKSNRRFFNIIITAHEHGIPVYCIDKDQVFQTLEKLDFDILLSCGFSYVIDEKCIKTAKRIAINVHPTLLPKYRGYRSGPYIIINGEEESGVTIHELVPEMDKGDILLQKAFPVTPFDTTKSVFRKAREVEPEMILEVIHQIEKGKEVRIPQNEAEATVYNKIRTPNDSEVDPKKSLLELYNEIRACDYDDYPAFFKIAGEKLLIRITREKKPIDEHDLI